MKTIDTTNFDGLQLKIASPEAIRSWSFGEVTKPETINYRTGRSERYGLFDEKIFGPEKDYECYCGKYRRIRYKDIVCEKCGVQVTKAIVRRERMGHVELASPVAHIWFLRNVQSNIALLLSEPKNEVEKVVYFANYIITKVNKVEKEEILRNLESEFKSKIKAATDEKTKEKLKELMLATKKEIEEIRERKILDEITYHRYSMRYSIAFEAQIGAEAIYNIFKNMNLDDLEKEILVRLEKISTIEREKQEKRLSLVRAFRNAGIRPEWMFLTALPVIPPGIRPMVALEGGRYATSDVNDLYRRVINRNNRLLKLKEISAPDVILRNEKRILQEAVDALIDNSMRRGQEATTIIGQKRQLKSLSDGIKSKSGLFRQNLLGKRVDYSGRSVIVIGPDLSIDECGLPKHMVLELFKPFVISKLLEREFTFNIRGANKLIEDSIPEVWEILEEVIEGKYVLLNRAPTLHRLGIQAFKPKMVEGNAIQLHPLVCTAFNADFDGDQMAVHLPLSEEAQYEAKTLMAANKNLLKPGSGESIVNPRMDMLLGSFWLTTEIPESKGEDKYFSSPNDAITANDFGIIDLRAKISVVPTTKDKYKKFEGKRFETTVGRLRFNSILPDDFEYINEQVGGNRMNQIIDKVITQYGFDIAPKIIDKIKAFGFKYATISGTTWGIDAVKVPEEKTSIIEKGRHQEQGIKKYFEEGLLSEDERYQKVIENWTTIRKEIEELMSTKAMDKYGSVYNLLTSGARGSVKQLIQLAGMKGIIASSSGKSIDFPIISSNKEGLSPLEYFITTYGARKGTSDTALKTAEAGYLTRRLVDVSQDLIISEDDCGTKNSKLLKTENVLGIEIPLSKSIIGRVIAQDLIDKNGKTLFKKGHLVNRENSKLVAEAEISECHIYSPLSCESLNGTCQKCYGLDLARNELVKIGEAVGIVAAQAIGEPGTQLTMRTFHSGGVAGADITQGLPRVAEIFERRSPKNPGIISLSNGEVTEIKRDGKSKSIVVMSNDDGSYAASKKKGLRIEYEMAYSRRSVVKVGDNVVKGQPLTDGSLNIEDLYDLAGREIAEEYIVNELNKVYELQGASISRKHMELIIKQMLSRVKVKDAADTNFTTGDVVEISDFRIENDRVKELGGEVAKGINLILGISEVALTTNSWLSSASFQHTTKVLINAATRGQVDRLHGLKENVIIGRLIPAGTGIQNKNIEE
ncbi:MAG: DNA-directed RNA polymerase subunit beta' [Candidatus Pacebacteria bacterium]|nr:DNA-directed RNA polymerase subunit beta' [Candidatus Paceibacterota bacterium]